MKRTIYHSLGALFSSIALSANVFAVGKNAYLTSIEGSTYNQLSALRATSDIQSVITTRNNLQTAKFALIADATDIDGDNSLEALAWDSGAGPTGGGLVPASSSAPKTDGWGSRIGYCAWDHGSDNSSVNRITGNLAVDNSDTGFVLISAGPDKTIDTSCSAADSGTAVNDDVLEHINVAELRRGVGVSDYIGKPVADLSALNALDSNTLKLNEIRLTRDTNNLYTWSDTDANGSGDTWELVTDSGFVPNTAGDAIYTEQPVGIGTSTVSTGNQLHIVDAADAATEIQSADTAGSATLRLRNNTTGVDGFDTLYDGLNDRYVIEGFNGGVSQGQHFIIERDSGATKVTQKLAVGTASNPTQALTVIANDAAEFASSLVNSNATGKGLLLKSDSTLLEARSASNVVKALLTGTGHLGLGGTDTSSRLTLNGGSLRFTGTFEGAGQIQSTSVVKIANANSAQQLYAGGISVSDLWTDADNYAQPNGIYSKGNLRVGGASPAMYVNAATRMVGIGNDNPGQALDVSGNIWASGNLRASEIEVTGQTLTLNSGTAGTPTLNATIVVDRGTETDATFKWDETNDNWHMGLFKLSGVADPTADYHVGDRLYNDARYMQVQVGTTLTSADDLNNITTPGFYQWTTSQPVNTPAGTYLYYNMQVVRNGVQFTQMLFGGSNGNNDSIFIRRRNSGVWEPWREHASVGYNDDRYAELASYNVHTAATNWTDGNEAQWGTGVDLRIQHDGSDSYVDNHTGQLLIRAQANSELINIQGRNATGVMQPIIQAGGTAPNMIAFYDGAEKFRTSALGALTTGDHKVTGALHVHNATNARLSLTEDGTSGAEFRYAGATNSVTVASGSGLGSMSTVFSWIRDTREVSFAEKLTALKGATVTGDLVVNSNASKLSAGTSGDAVYTIEADTDNNNEGDNPRIEMYQDGGLTGAAFGFDEAVFGGNEFGLRLMTTGSWYAPIFTVPSHSTTLDFANAPTVGGITLALSTDKAPDSELLDNLDSTQFLRSDVDDIMGGNLTLAVNKAIRSAYNSGDILKDHNNGNITLSAAGGDLYLGHVNTSKVRLYTDLYDDAGSYVLIDKDGDYMATTSGDSRAKIRLWNGNETKYAIGMGSAYTLGYLSDYAMTFQMNATANRGWWWGTDVDTNNGGSMSLTNDGRLWVNQFIDTPSYRINGTEVIDSSRNAMFATVDIFDSNTHLERGSGNSLRIQTNSGYLEVGPMNTTWAHLSTDRGKFYFNKQVTADGGFYVYNGGANTQIADDSGKLFYQSQDTDARYLNLGELNIGKAYNNVTYETADFDALATVGEHRFINGDDAATLHEPVNGHLYYFGFGGGDVAERGAQVVIKGQTSNSMYYRTNKTGGWNSWRKVVTTADYGSGGGIDADLLDSLDASQFLRSDANDTVTAQLSFNRTGAPTIGGSAMANAWALIGSTTNGIGFDDNEMVKAGGDLYVGTKDDKTVILKANNQEIVHVTSLGVTSYRDLTINSNAATLSAGISGDAVFTIEADTDNDNENDNARIEMLQDGGLVGAALGFDETVFGSNTFGLRMNASGIWQSPIFKATTASTVLDFTSTPTVGGVAVALSTDKAVDSELLDGLDSTQFARTDAAAQFDHAVTVVNDLTVKGGQKALQLKSDGVGDHVYMEFYARDAALSTRSAYFGFPSTASNRLDIYNETGGELHLKVNGHTAKLGTSGTFDALTLSENGTQLNAKYLGINATADNAQLLDNLDSSQFVRADADTTLTGRYTFTGTGPHLFGGATGLGNTAVDTIVVRRGLYVDGGDVSGDHAYLGFGAAGSFNTRFEGHDNIVNLYAASGMPTLKVAGNIVYHAGNDGAGSNLDADLIDSLDSSQFLRSDTADTMSARLTLTSGVTVSNSDWNDQLVKLQGGSPNLWLHQTDAGTDAHIGINGDAFYILRDANQDGTYDAVQPFTLSLLNGNAAFEGTVTVDNLALRAGHGIKSLHNNANIMQDHANGNVTLNAAGAHLYLGYLNTSAVRVYTSLYDDAGAVELINKDGDYVNVRTGDNRTKFRLWNGNVYGIGMGSAYTLGYLSDYAMTFQMNSTAGRGWWWGTDGDTNNGGSMSLTNDGRLWVSQFIDTPLLKENGTDLSAKYLGINAKAVDAELLDGFNSTQFARTDVAESFDAGVTFNGLATFNYNNASAGTVIRIDDSSHGIAGGTAGELGITGADGTATVVFSGNGGSFAYAKATSSTANSLTGANTVFHVNADDGYAEFTGTVEAPAYTEGGTVLSAKYLGINATANNAQLLDNLDSSQFLRSDVAGTKTGDLDIIGGDGALRLKAGVADHVYMEFYARTASPSTRSGWFGVGGSGGINIDVHNEMGGNVQLGTNGKYAKLMPDGRFDAAILQENGTDLSTKYIQRDANVNNIRGNKEFYGTDAGGNYGTAPIEIKEVNQVNTTQSTDAYAPALTFHWGGRQQQQLALHADGKLVVRDGNTHAIDATFAAGAFEENGTVLSMKYLGINATADNSELLDNLDSSQLLRSDTDDTLTGLVTIDRTGEALGIGDTSLNNANAHIRLGNVEYSWHINYKGITAGTAGNEYQIISAGTSGTGKGIQVDHDGNFEVLDGAGGVSKVFGTSGRLFYLNEDIDDRYINNGELNIAASFDEVTFETVDYNTLQTVGEHKFVNGGPSTNTPGAGSHQYYFGLGGGDTANRGAQVVIEGATFNDLYFRTDSAGGWNSWRRVLTDDELGTLDAGTLGGFSSSQFLRSDANDTVTSQLIFNRTSAPSIAGTNMANAWALIGSTSNGIAIDDNEIVKAGGDLYLGLKGNNVIKVRANNNEVMHITDTALTAYRDLALSATSKIMFNAPGDRSRIYSEVSGVDTTTVIEIGDDDNDAFLVRNQHWSHGAVDLLKVKYNDFTYKGDKIWHAGNDGASSGMDADLLDNLNASQFLRSDTAATLSAGSLTIDSTSTALLKLDSATADTRGIQAYDNGVQRWQLSFMNDHSFRVRRYDALGVEQTVPLQINEDGTVNVNSELRLNGTGLSFGFVGDSNEMLVSDTNPTWNGDTAGATINWRGDNANYNLAHYADFYQAHNHMQARRFYIGGAAADGTLFADATNLYEGGAALNTLYLGLNAKADDSALLDGLDSTQFLRKDTGQTFTGPSFTLDSTAILRLDNTGDVSLSSVDHALQVGIDTGLNIALDNNGIQARNNGAAAELRLNSEGGNVFVNGVNVRDGSILNVGTVAFARLPTGTGASQVATGNHGHNVWDLSATKGTDPNIDLNWSQDFWTARATNTDPGTLPASYVTVAHFGVDGIHRGFQIASHYGSDNGGFWIRRGSDNVSSENGPGIQNWKKIYTDAYHPQADNAGLLDNLDSAQFLRSDVDDTFSANLTVAGDLTLDDGASPRRITFGGTTVLEVQTGDVNGDAVALGAGALTAVGSGESVAQVLANVGNTLEEMYVSSDGSVFLTSNMQAGWASRKTASFNIAGEFDAPILKEGGTSLSAKYLGINDTANDAQSLGGVNSQWYASRDAAYYSGTEDFNSFTNYGTYRMEKTNMVNAPNGYNWGHLVVSKQGDNHLVQTWYSDQQGDVYYRTNWAGTWRSWTQVRDAKTLDGLDSSQFLRSDTNDTFTGDTLTLDGSAKLRLSNAVDVSLSSTGHAFQIGSSAGQNIAIDGNEIASRNNGVAADLLLNQDGGTVKVNGVSVRDGSILNAGTVAFARLPTGTGSSQVAIGSHSHNLWDLTGAKAADPNIDNDWGEDFWIAKATNLDAGTKPQDYITVAHFGVNGTNEGFQIATSYGANNDGFWIRRGSDNVGSENGPGIQNWRQFYTSTYHPQADNADSLGGVVAANYARTDITETFSQGVNVSGELRLNGEGGGLSFGFSGDSYEMSITDANPSWNSDSFGAAVTWRGDNVDYSLIHYAGAFQANKHIQSPKYFIGNAKANGTLLADSTNLYEGGTALSTKYLGISAKAGDADKLDNLDSTQFARSDTADTITGQWTYGHGKLDMTNTSAQLRMDTNAHKGLGANTGYGNFVVQSGMGISDDKTKVSGDGAVKLQFHTDAQNGMLELKVYDANGTVGTTPALSQTYTFDRVKFNAPTIHEGGTALNDKYMRSDTSDTMNGSLTVVGDITLDDTASPRRIKFGGTTAIEMQTGDVNGDALALGAGGLTAVGSGESAAQVMLNVANTSEQMYVSSDGSVHLTSNMQSGWVSRKTATFNTAGEFDAPTLMESGTALSAKYLGIAAKAADSEMLDNLNSTQFLRSDASDSFTADTLSLSSTSKLRLENIVDITLASTDHAFQIGTTSSLNLAIDNNEIQARNNGAVSDLNLNAEGGAVRVSGVNVRDASILSSGTVALARLPTGSGAGFDADLLDGVEGSAYARTDVAETFSGDVTVGSVLLDGSEGIYFESSKHGITWNDENGNFNIRVGHTDQSAVEKSTEAGWAFQDEWSQSSGWRGFYISTASLAVNDTVTWREQLKYDTNSVWMRYQGGDRLQTTSAGGTLTGIWNATTKLQEAGTDLSAKYLGISATAADADLFDGVDSQWYAGREVTYYSGTEDFNSFTNYGVYRLAKTNMVNAPGGYNWGHLVVSKQDTNYLVQTWYSDQQGDVYYRTNWGGTWRSWTHVRDAKTLGGLASSQFLRSDTDTTLSGVLTSDGIKIGDNESLNLGSSDSLRLHHDATNSHINNYTGQLFVSNYNHGGEIIVRAEDTGGTMRNMIYADPDTGIQLLSAGSLSLQTTASGVNIFGNLDVSGDITLENYLYGEYGTMMRSIDEWLRINDDDSHGSGVFFGTSVVRTDGELQVGSLGSTFKVSGSVFTYNGNDVYHAGNKPWELTGQSTAVGSGALFNDDGTSNYNTAVGYWALGATTSGAMNSALGRHALRLNTTGQKNSAFGNNSMYSNTTGSSNSSIGDYSLYDNTTGMRNTALGAISLRKNVSGSENVAIGYQSGFSALGSGNVFIGSKAGFNETGSNTLYIDNSNTSTPLIYGDFTTDDVTINGDLTATGNSYAVSHVDTSDGRLKTEQALMKGSKALGLLKDIEAVTYYWDDTNDLGFEFDDDRLQYGVIAQQVKEVIPEVVHYRELDNGDGYYSVNYNGFTPILIAATNQQQEQLDDHEARIGRLEGEMAVVKTGVSLVSDAIAHADLEGEEYAIYYRGEGQLVNGRATVELPEYFEELAHSEGRTVLLTPKFSGVDSAISQLAASLVEDGVFEVRALDGLNPAQSFYWEVKARRMTDSPLSVATNELDLYGY